MAGLESRGISGVVALIEAARDREAEILRASRVGLRSAGLAASAARACHNDLHHLNLLDDGDRLWLVDWEYGGVGDPLFDLASLACQHGYTAAERVALLDAYGAGDGNTAEMLDAACTAFDYVQWLWYLVWAARNPAAGHECAVRATVLAGRLPSCLRPVIHASFSNCRCVKAVALQ